MPTELEAARAGLFFAFLFVVAPATGCRADTAVTPDETTDASGEAPGCWSFAESPGWAIGTTGDVLCMQRQRFVLLLADGTWDGWQVRWTSEAGVRRASVTGSELIEHADIHWDVRGEPAGGMTIERPGGRKVRMAALSAEAKSAARSRLAQIGDVMADCKRLRHCWDSAPASAREMADPEALYSAGACRGLVNLLCAGREP